MAVAAEVPLTLVTGASGFIASHIIHQLLTKGQVRVRGTVRSLKKEDKVKPLREMVPDATYPLELVEADLNDEDSWKEAVKGCSYVYHVASPLPSSIPRDENELILPAVNGTLNVLRACSESGTVKRVVLTSSLAAISGGLYGVSEYKYTEKDWSDETTLPTYEKSKLLAEKAAWDFMKEKLEEEKKFELVAVHPAVVIGPPLTPATGESTSLQTVKKLLSGEMPVLLDLCLPLVDVRDVAAAQIAAMEIPEAAGKRFILTAENRWLGEISNVMSEEFQPQGYKLPSWTLPKPGVWILGFFNKTVKMIYPTIGNVITLSNEKMVAELQITPRPVEESIIDSCYALIEKGVVQALSGYKPR